MRTEVEAPGVEPRDVSGGVTVAAVGKAFGAVQALDGVSLRVSAREVVAVVGPSGCGKSTLLELVCGLQAPDSGTIEAPRAALMPQRDGLLPWLSALDNAALALRVAGSHASRRAPQPTSTSPRSGSRASRSARPSALSGGMRQRVAFLRTLLAGRPLLCLDEPFGALDALTRGQMQRWLADALEREPRTVLLVTHDVEEAVLLADRIVLLSSRPGRVIADARRRDPEAAPSRRRRGRRAARARADRAGGRMSALIIVLIGLAGWEALVRLGGVDELILPAPTQVLDSLWTDRSILAPDLATTTWEVLFGLAARDRRRRAPRRSPCTCHRALGGRCGRW